MSASSAAVAETVTELTNAAGRWEGIAIVDHRFGGTEFTPGPREIGHVHRWGMLDIPYRRALREALVGEGLTGGHHLPPESGWTTCYILSPVDAARARWLLGLSSLSHVDALQQAGKADVPSIDVAAELDEFDVSDAVREAFERRRTTPA